VRFLDRKITFIVLLGLIAQAVLLPVQAADMSMLEMPALAPKSAPVMTAPAQGPVSDPVNKELSDLDQVLKKHATEASGDASPETPSATSCDTAFLDSLYINLHEATCRDSTMDGCGHFDWMRLLGVGLTAVPLTMNELTMMMNNGHVTVGVETLKGAARFSSRDSDAIMAEERLRKLYGELTDSRKRSEFFCILKTLEGIVQDGEAKESIARVRERVTAETSKANKMLAYRVAVLAATAGAMYGTNRIMQNIQLKAAAGETSCTAALPDDVYYSADKVKQAEESYKYMNMVQGTAGCLPSYRLDSHVMSFIQLPYVKQRAILESSPEVCKYYKGFNDRLVAAIQPSGVLSDLKGPDGPNSVAEFSTISGPSTNTPPTVFSFDYDRKTTETRTLRVQAPDDPHEIIYDFKKEGSVEVLSRIRYEETDGTKRDLAPQQLKKITDEGKYEPEALRAVALYRDYQYYRPVIALCIFKHSESNCVDAWKKTQTPDSP
jgi:hypothetical protein